MIHVTMMRDKSAKTHGQYDTHPRQGVTTSVRMVAIDLLKSYFIDYLLFGRGVLFF